MVWMDIAARFLLFISFASFNCCGNLAVNCICAKDSAIAFCQNFRLIQLSLNVISLASLWNFSCMFRVIASKCDASPCSLVKDAWVWRRVRSFARAWISPIGRLQPMFSVESEASVTRSVEIWRFCDSKFMYGSVERPLLESVLEVLTVADWFLKVECSEKAAATAGVMSSSELEVRYPLRSSVMSRVRLLRWYWLTRNEGLGRVGFISIMFAKSFLTDILSDLESREVESPLLLGGRVAGMVRHWCFSKLRFAVSWLMRIEHEAWGWFHCSKTSLTQRTHSTSCTYSDTLQYCGNVRAECWNVTCMRRGEGVWLPTAAAYHGYTASTQPLV